MMPAVAGTDSARSFATCLVGRGIGDARARLAPFVLLPRTPMPKPIDPGLSRRSFLKGSAAAGLAGSGVAAARATVAPPPQSFGPGQHEIALLVNGSERKVTVETRTTLLDALRDGLDLTGSKKICDRGACGGCTVLVNGEPTVGCLMLAMDAVGQDLRTIEGLSQGEQVHPLVQNFVHCDALQCGFCTPGMVMSSLACLEQRGKPTVEQVRHDLAGNLCRCGTYGRVIEAIQRTAVGGGK
jgi:xanthine dehydrogenase YagT iron-sulfur-binding subunit